MSLIEAILDNQIGPPLKELLSKVLNGCNGGGDYESPLPVTCMISDVAMSLFTLDMAEEMGITAVALETCSGCGMLSYLRHWKLLNKGIIPLKDLLLVDHIPKSDTIRPIGPTPTDDIDYIQWLDNQEPNSILYVNFGTIVVLAQEQLVELAWGLANSHQKFFWVVRGNPQITLEFEEVIKERGLLASWCDQERVLGHPSIGGFVTHCGWNSMIESISSGVPMICWPFYAEQVTNSWYCCNILGVGVTMNDQGMKRDEVTRVVKEVMEGEKGKRVKKKALEWRKLAKEATLNSH
ncbi:7-deoxyloganetin glucosyltransferase, partial [Bienertia sinuspersici]